MSALCSVRQRLRSLNWQTAKAATGRRTPRGDRLVSLPKFVGHGHANGCQYFATPGRRQSSRFTIDAKGYVIGVLIGSGKTRPPDQSQSAWCFPARRNVLDELSLPVSESIE
jgi:hypothetical protein